tara:strand:- start:102 stop:386 length:285 start_codon:yes stop_codon:yes gene_type:complete
MIDTITKYQFSDEMVKHGFSYKGSKALFNYLEQLEEDCDIKIEFDPIAFRCEYVEYESLEELNEEYNEDYDMQSLSENTQVIDVDGERLIIQAF